MKYLHTMVRVADVEASLSFYRDALGLAQQFRRDFPQGRCTLIVPAAPGDASAQVELTHNWEPETHAVARKLGHLAPGGAGVSAARHGPRPPRTPRPNS